MANGKAREKLGKTVSVRSAPAVRSGNKTGEIRPYSEFDFVGYVDDLDHPDDPQYTWVELASGGYANYIYPPNGVRLTILQEPGTEPPATGTPEPTPAGAFPLVIDGVTYVNRDEIVWVVG